jgi:hypothetical protein
MSLANEDSLAKTILSFGWSRNSLCKRAPLRYMSWITYIQLLVLQILSSRPKMWISVLRVLQLFFRHVSDRANTSVELVRTDTCSLWNYEPSEGHTESTRGRHWQAFMASILPKRRRIVYSTQSHPRKIEYSAWSFRVWLVDFDTALKPTGQ